MTTSRRFLFSITAIALAIAATVFAIAALIIEQYSA
jgi:hypothetical protein